MSSLKNGFYLQHKDDLKEAVRIEKVSYCYHSLLSPTLILENVSLTINQGDTCAITGPSGAGKSTLMNLIGLLEKPLIGEIIISGCETASANPERRAVLRNLHIGFVFQNFNLLPRLSATENVALPLMYRGLRKNEALEHAKEHLHQVGLGDRLLHRPHELSGGQCQRVAIARALVGNPSLLLADEPTGNLDDKTGSMIMELLISLNASRKTTLIMVTHDDAIATLMRRHLRVSDCKVTEI